MYTSGFQSLLSMLLVNSGIAAATNTPTKPDILLILADDMGFSDTGFMGSGIETPNIDRLAKNGLVFTNFYNSGRSCPSRASLLTGLYPHQTGLGWMTRANLGTAGYSGDLNNQCVTIAQVLNTNGYATYMTGKWHLTYEKYSTPSGPTHNWPIQRGFEKFFGHLAGGGSYFSPGTLTYNNQPLQVPTGFYLTDAVTDSTVSFLNSHFNEKPQQPYFFYVGYFAPHRPLHALEKDIAKYRGKFKKGWDCYRNQRLKQLKKKGLVAKTLQLPQRDAVIPDWNSLSETEKDLWDARMAVYAAQIDRMDQGIGKILRTLQLNGRLDNTIILFLSDNGASAETQGSITNAFNPEWIGREKPELSYLTPWANVSNTPFRNYKMSVYEGGIATPLIVHWPAGVQKGLSNQTGHIIDIMPTLLDVAHASYPTNYNGFKIHPMSGMSLKQAFQNNKINKHRNIFFEHEGNRAVISGNWKLVAPSSGKVNYKGEWELYDLKNDRTESTNMALQHPKMVEQLSQLWEEWAHTHQVYPLDGRTWAEKTKADKGNPLRNNSTTKNHENAN